MDVNPPSSGVLVARPARNGLLDDPTAHIGIVRISELQQSGWTESGVPKVSIILPTFNRARFLPEAFAAIRGQQFVDWELVIVDDGSTDETAAVVPELCKGMSQPWRYIRQENSGAYAARNTGLDDARGEYVAFYDSDDVWLPHHLGACMAALEAHSDVDWVYGASRIVDFTTGSVTSDNCFYIQGKARPFLKAAEARGDGVLVSWGDDAVCMQISHGLYCGLQASVIRKRVFQERRLPTGPVAESIGDQLFLIDCLRAGAKLGCLNEVHFEYRVHDANSCAAGAGPEQVARRLRVYEAAIRGSEELLHRKDLSSRATTLLRQRIASQYFWDLGYAAHLRNGDHRKAFAAFHRALRYDPQRLAFWKVYCASVVKCAWNALSPMGWFESAAVRRSGCDHQCRG